MRGRLNGRAARAGSAPAEWVQPRDPTARSWLRCRVYNRTRSKAEPLTDLGATVVDSPRRPREPRIVFTMVAGPETSSRSVLGPAGPATRARPAPRIIVDSTTISPQASAEVRAHGLRARRRAARRAPSAATPRSSRPGCSPSASPAPRRLNEVRALPRHPRPRRTYVGEGELARLAKICHNLMLGVVAQSHGRGRRPGREGRITRADLSSSSTTA